MGLRFADWEFKHRMAVFMHMHSVLERDPAHSLTFYFSLQANDNLNVHFSDRVITVQIDDQIKKTFEIDLNAIYVALRLEDLYPDSEYKAELVDAKKNQWKVAKRNSFIRPLTGKFEVVELPASMSQKISSEPAHLNLDRKKYEQIFVSSSNNIWPENEPLKDANIVVHLPSFTVNDTTYPSRKFVFTTNYEKVKKSRSSYGRCPSTDEIFRFSKFSLKI